MTTVNRRQFLQTTALTGLAASVIPSGSSHTAMAARRPMRDDISLAAWSLYRPIWDDKITNLDLPRVCREDFDLNGLEFVNTLFELPVMNYLKELKQNLADYNVEPVLLMVSFEGRIGSSDKKERMASMVAHRKWIDIAQFLGCHAIRADFESDPGTSPDDAVKYGAEAFLILDEYAKQAQINVLVENHGGISSDPDNMLLSDHAGISSNPDVLVKLMKAVDSPDFGTLPDFGNFPSRLDKTEAVLKMMPWAGGVSVKTYYGEDKKHHGFDLEKVLRAVMNSGYHGYYGIECEGKKLDPWEEIRLAKAVIERVVFNR